MCVCVCVCVVTNTIYSIAIMFNIIAVSTKLWIPVLVPMHIKAQKLIMTIPCKFISRKPWDIDCCSSEPHGVSAFDSWVLQLCIENVLNHFSPRQN